MKNPAKDYLGCNRQNSYLRVSESNFLRQKNDKKWENDKTFSVFCEKIWKFCQRSNFEFKLVLWKIPKNDKSDLWQSLMFTWKI